MKQFWKKHILMRILIYLVLGVIALILFARVFMRVYPEFVGRPTRADRADYLKRAGAYYDGERFFLPGGVEAARRSRQSEGFGQGHAAGKSPADVGAGLFPRGR